MPTDLRVSLPAALVAIACASLVTVRVVRAPVPAPRPPMTAADRQEIAKGIAAFEATWTSETSQNFPSDHWSQRDDFHGREYKKIIDVANEKGLRIEDILRGIDDDIHRRHALRPDDSDERNARAIPCKPRPFYD